MFTEAGSIGDLSGVGALVDRLMIRASMHFYNTEAEIDRLAEALGELVHGCKAV